MFISKCERTNRYGEQKISASSEVRHRKQYVVNKIRYANESSSEVKALLWASKKINIVGV